MAGPFELQIRAFIDGTENKYDAVVADAVQETYYRIVEKSPVDTGFFRACWGYQVGSPGAVSVRKTGTSSSPQPARDIEVFMPAGGKVHYISNALPYAMRLEAGYSDKAPQGMVGLTILEFDTIIRRSVEKANAS